MPWEQSKACKDNEKRFSDHRKKTAADGQRNMVTHPPAQNKSSSGQQPKKKDANQTYQPKTGQSPLSDTSTEQSEYIKLRSMAMAADCPNMRLSIISPSSNKFFAMSVILDSGSRETVISDAIVNHLATRGLIKEAPSEIRNRFNKVKFVLPSDDKMIPIDRIEVHIQIVGAIKSHIVYPYVLESMSEYLIIGNKDMVQFNLQSYLVESMNTIGLHNEHDRLRDSSLIKQTLVQPDVVKGNLVPIDDVKGDDKHSEIEYGMRSLRSFFHLDSRDRTAEAPSMLQNPVVRASTPGEGKSERKGTLSRIGATRKFSDETSSGIGPYTTKTVVPLNSAHVQDGTRIRNTELLDQVVDDDVPELLDERYDDFLAPSLKGRAVDVVYINQSNKQQAKEIADLIEEFDDIFEYDSQPVRR